MSGTLAALGGVPVTSEPDRLAAAHLRERLEAQLALYHTGQPLRNLRTPFAANPPSQPPSSSSCPARR